MASNPNFQDTDKIYHYTNFNTALAILQSKSLKYGRLNRMNDIHESSKTYYSNDNSYDLYNEIKEEVLKYRQLSFSYDIITDTETSLGFDLHQMWGLYGDSCKGVCLVFGRYEIEAILEDAKHCKVSYSNVIESSVLAKLFSISEIRNGVLKNFHDIFFCKRKEWEHEQEYRIVKRFPDTTKEEYLKFFNALKYVVVTDVLKNTDEVEYYRQIKGLKSCLNTFDNEIPLLTYGNGLMEYYLVDDTNNLIWNNKHEYNIPIVGHNCEIDI